MFLAVHTGQPNTSSLRKVSIFMSRSFGLPPTRGNRVFRNSRYTGQSANRSRTINTDRFINKAQVITGEEVFVPQYQFADFQLDPRLKGAVVAKGYVTPTPIQDGALPPVLAGRDLIGLANTGTGKTAVFLLPIINSLLQGGNGSALIVVPTRELASQIDDDFKSFTRGMGLYSALVVGGSNMHRQIMTLRRRPHVIIGTPGRLKDLINQGELKLANCSTFVLDEADRMVDMGFIRDIRFIIGHLPDKRQSLCLSATITPDVQSIINGLLQDPVTVSVRTRETSDHVDQDVIRADSKDQKLAILQELLGKEGYDKVLVFCSTKYGAQRLSDTLMKSGIRSEAIHGNKSQPQRQRALDAFKSDRAQVLVATDVAARGLDIPAVSHVINFDIPNTYEDYVHRIGRTGRAGRAGQALTFIPSR
jgi:ATP-dependent RNA helicase RhlE